MSSVAPNRLLRLVQVAALLGAVTCSEPAEIPPATTGAGTGGGGELEPGGRGGAFGGAGGAGATTGTVGTGGETGVGGWSRPGGAGGAAGKGGTAGSGGVGGAAGVGGTAEPFPPWLADDGIWSPDPPGPPIDEACVTLSADPASLPLLPLQWETCGKGCEKARVLQGGSDIAQLPHLSTQFRDGIETPLLIQRQPFYYRSDRGKSGRALYRIIDLISGRTIAALQRAMEPLQGGCHERTWSRENALHLELVVAKSYQKGTYDLETNRWIWQQPLRPGVGVETCFPLEFQAGGRTLYLCGTKIYASLDPGSSEVALLEDLGEEYVADSGADDADLAIWTEMKYRGQGSRVRGWAPDGQGVRTLLSDLPGDTCLVGLSETRIAGAMIEPRGRRGCDASMGKFTIWYAERSGEGAGPGVTISPQISDLSMAFYRTLSTAGDFISVQVARKGVPNDDRDNVILVRTTDWAKRWIPPLPGHTIYHHTLTKRYLYLALTGPGAGYGVHDSVYRYDLTMFDSLGEPME